MLTKLPIVLFVSVLFHQAKTQDITFKNVMVVCENEVVSNQEITFVTIVTGDSLKQHLPSGETCFRIEINHANVRTIFNGAFANIKNVNYLLLENNNIKDIYPGAFTNLTVREAMSLKFNKLEVIRNGVFNNVAVPSLYLSSNAISKIQTQAFDNMPTLEALYLDNNLLTYIDSNWFKNTPKLHKVVLKHNSILYIPVFAFKNLVANKYTPLYLDLSHNAIRSVDIDAFKKPNKYGYLSLANNQMTDLYSDWLRGVQVRKLDLSNNHLQCLVQGGLAGPYATNYIDGNPWICECLENMKKKEDEEIFGHIVAEESFKRCNILAS